MGREFLSLFDHWADSYDDTVSGHDEQYKEVFRRYPAILKEITRLAGQHVIEFGSGTGNLTAALLQADKKVFGIEPSEAMKKAALQKGIPNVFHDGDFLSFPAPPFEPDTIVSSYAFHHLTDEEKKQAIHTYGNILPSGGKIVFADTMFQNQAAHQAATNKAKAAGFDQLAEDLETEYYPSIGVLKQIFEEEGFSTSFHQMNDFVWIVEAKKRE
ncbi:class I SAM-dependent DNA methyltransferase [Bacillus altitudinis]|uniref:class I SAM-dependent DNA methyltransferase n=1 Tax=Bacillus altitudinis TaxID=293387 RepID=UPI00203ECFD1|nr:class I SAM-dependent methyltransferase [Bacillus altitudinis]MCM3062350.1 class I SAM-dependent methyltransferase [Bacillus altitudinis]MCM3075054.1 class I SAM-dependent methyltransferase [Bacillus altitudinis]MCY7454985.1 class I SAM-dependent methyltransferase [Bacillus altitudinis]MCY7714310.1 class I SAM-dependent methyltransferase [Bacillus altitudinis]